MVKEDTRLGLGPMTDGPVDVQLRWANLRTREHHVRGPKKSPRKIVLWRLILRKVEEEKRTAIFFCEEGEEYVDANYHPLKISSDIFSCYLQINFFIEQCIDWGGKSRFQTWAPYRVQCPCLQCQHQPRWILLNFPSVDMGTLSKTLRFSLYPSQWVKLFPKRFGTLTQNKPEIPRSWICQAGANRVKGKLNVALVLLIMAIMMLMVVVMIMARMVVVMTMM